MLGAYHDARCVDAAGALTKRDCTCAPGGVVSRADATCGYYAAWDRANAAFLGDVFAGAVNDTGVLYEVAAPLLVPGGRVSATSSSGELFELPRRETSKMGKSAKVNRIGNFQTHKKNVRRRSLVVEKRPKKDATTYTSAEARQPKAPKAAVRDGGAKAAK